MFEKIKKEQEERDLLYKNVSKIYSIMKTFSISAIIANIVITFVYIYFNKTDNEDIVVILVLLSIVIPLIISLVVVRILCKDKNRRILELKFSINETYKNVVLLIFKNIFDDVTYYDKKGFKYEDIRSLGVVPGGSTFYSNDYLSAKYKNVHFECSDMHIEKKKTDSDGNTTYITVFKGQLYVFDFNKPFKSNVKVYRGSTSFLRQDSKVLLEDVDFNNNFSVYAKEEIDAFYILTPNVMEKIKKVTESIFGVLDFIFIDNKLYIAVNNNKDLFEYDESKNFNPEKEMKKIENEIKTILDFIDILDLDNDLFKREV